MDHQNLSAPETAQINVAEPLYGAAALAVRDQLREPADLTVAIRVAQRMLTVYGDSSTFPDVFAYAQAHGGLTEALRILLRACGAEAGEGQ
ncbi:hypothetical protein ABZZ80_05785 [Streptomyces sp. NPDC006356]